MAEDAKYKGWGWAPVIGGLMLLIGVATLIQRVFFPMEYAATSLNRSINQCSGTASQHSSNIDEVLSELVKCDVISTESADRFKQLYNEKKLTWSTSRREWVTAERVAKDKKKADWLEE